MTFAIIVFVSSFLGIVALFALKEREAVSGRTYLPHLRESADREALRMKVLLHAFLHELEKIPPRTALATRALIREGALLTATFAAFLEAQARRLADMVSYKRHFERRDVRSDFLKKVQNAKGSRDPSLDRVLEE